MVSLIHHADRANTPASIPSERQVVNKTGSFHPRCIVCESQRFGDVAVAKLTSIPLISRVDPKRNSVFRTEAKVYLKHAQKASDQQTRAYEQNTGERDFRD